MYLRTELFHYSLHNLSRTLTGEYMPKRAMWSTMPELQVALHKPEVSCNSCRRRKVRCDRRRPQCRACEQTGQLCEYLLRPGKPGPKIGSFQRQKRKGRERQTKTSAEKHPKTLASPGVASQDGSVAEGAPFGTDTEGGMPTSNLAERWRERLQNTSESRINIDELSFILHPSHEVATSRKDQSPGQANHEEEKLLVDEACAALGQSREFVEEMIQLYFTNMVAINLFHKPSFANKIGTITSQIQLSALLAAMMGYAARFHLIETDLLSQDNSPPGQAECSPEYFVNKAVKLVDESLAECGDESPPLCVVQALIITTHCQLTRGVHGKAWRSLGMCVRLAYELNLHLIDTRCSVRTHDAYSIQWQDDEEKRRAWWAIWEMDVFASTIRRTPTALNWAHMETLLPVDDADWFNGRPASSAFMERDPTQRWKALERSGNHSPKAWFIVVNSLMKDAQLISDPRGVPSETDPVQNPESARRKSDGVGVSPVEDARHQLEMLANTVQCFLLALPQHLRYRGQYLAFDLPTPSQTGSMRQLHCGIYNIFVMAQLARLMIHRYDLFHQRGRAGQPGPYDKPAYHDLDNPSIRQYFEAADNILAIVNRSSEDHVKHINPFLLSTIWLACAVQLLRKYLGSLGANPTLITSRFDVLYLTYKRCVSFWGAKSALQGKLKSLEMQLEGHFQTTQDDRPQTSWEGSRSSPAQRRMSYFPDALDNSDSAKLVTEVPESAAHIVYGTRSRPNPHKSPEGEGPIEFGATGHDQLLSTSPPPLFEVGESRTVRDRTTNSHTDSDQQLGVIPETQLQLPQDSQLGPTNYRFPLPPSPAASQNTTEGTNETNSKFPAFMQMPPPPVMNPEIFVSSQAQNVEVESVDQNDLAWWPLDLPADLKGFLSGMSDY